MKNVFMNIGGNFNEAEWNEENNNKAILKNDQEDFGKYTEKWKQD